MLPPKLGGSWLLPPWDFPQTNESHPMDHDSNSSGHTNNHAWHQIRAVGKIRKIRNDRLIATFIKIVFP
jgi:hypothetical protein